MIVTRSYRQCTYFTYPQQPLAFSDVQSLKKFMAISGYDSGGMDILMDNVKIWIEKNGVDEGTVKDVEQDLAGHQMYWVSEVSSTSYSNLVVLFEHAVYLYHRKRQVD